MSHLESLIVEYLEWRGYLVRRNIKVGRLKHGGWEMELDVIAYNPHAQDLVHCEPSMDAHSWPKREARYKKKMAAARKYVLNEIFSWLPAETELRQIAVFPSHPAGKDSITGATIVSIDEVMAEIRAGVVAEGPAQSGAIPEQFPLLRVLQLSHCGYVRTKPSATPALVLSQTDATGPFQVIAVAPGLLRGFW